MPNLRLTGMATITTLLDSETQRMVYEVVGSDHFVESLITSNFFDGFTVRLDNKTEYLKPRRVVLWGPTQGEIDHHTVLHNPLTFEPEE